MIYLFHAISQSTLIVVLFKLFPRYKIDNLQAIVVNYLLASIIGFSLCGGVTKIVEIPDQKWFVFALFCGFFLMYAFNIFALSTQKVGIAISMVSSKMSVVIPVFLGVILYNEKFTFVRGIAIALALLAFYLTFKKDSKSEFKKIYLLFPILLFIGTGSNDSLFNYTEKRLLNNDLMFFLSSAFLVSLILGSLTFAFRSIKKPQKIEFKNIIAGLLLGLLNFGSTYYFLKCLGVFDSSVFFPVFNVSIVSLAAIIGYFIFKEPLRKINWVGIGLAVVAIVLIAVTSM